MDDATPEQRVAEHREFWVRANLVMMCLLGAGNVFLLIEIIPKFMEIYAEAWPGMPLPVLTEFIIRERIALALFSVALLIPEFVMFAREKPYAPLWINLALIWFFLQGGITVYALFSPMVGGIITGDSDAGR